MLKIVKEIDANRVFEVLMEAVLLFLCGSMLTLPLFLVALHLAALGLVDMPGNSELIAFWVHKYQMEIGLSLSILMGAWSVFCFGEYQNRNV